MVAYPKNRQGKFLILTRPRVMEGWMQNAVFLALR
jgi:hypothetical protein